MANQQSKEIDVPVVVLPVIEEKKEILQKLCLGSREEAML